MPASPAPIADALDDTGEIRLRAAKLCILKADLSEEPPGPDWEALIPNPSEHWVFTAIPDVISRSAGAGRVDAFTLRIDLGKSEGEDRAHEFLHLPAYNRQYEIRALDDEGVPNLVLAWGVEVQRSIDLGEKSESVHVTCRLDDYLFGQPLLSYPVLDVSGDPNVRVDVQRPLIWNPETDINGTPRVRSNLSVWQYNPHLASSGPLWRFVCDPESVRTTASDLFQRTDEGVIQGAVDARGWSLHEAAYSLCWWCNPDETWIDNPQNAQDIASQFGFVDDAGAIDDDKILYLKNQAQSYGNYLPRALDELLGPHGFGWFIEHAYENEITQLRVSTLRFYRRGEGMKVGLKRAKDGYKTKQNTNVNQARTTASIVDMANVVLVRGAFQRREATFYLARAWAEADDALNVEDLSLGDAKQVEKPFVGRKLVLNESGDYTGLRPEITRPYDVGPLFRVREFRSDSFYNTGDRAIYDDKEWLAKVDVSAAAFDPLEWTELGPAQLNMAYRRREFLPCLSEHSRGDDAVSNGKVLEYYDYATPTSPGNAWDAATAYVVGDVVTVGGNRYRCVAVGTGYDPRIAYATDYWHYVCEVDPDLWASGTEYNIGDEVLADDGLHYIAARPSEGLDPVDHPLDWGLVDQAAGTWTRWKHQFSVAQHECAIIFDSPEVPGILWADLKDDKRDRWRVTCSIEGDRRVQGRAVRRESSPNEQDVVLTLDLPDKFQDAAFVNGSKYRRFVHSDPPPYTVFTDYQYVRDDTAKALAYAEKVQEIEDSAEYSFSLMIEGLLHPELQIGMLVEKIDGIDVTLDANVRATERTPRYPQIVGFNYRTQMPQMCEVLLETFKAERPEV